VLAAGPSVPIHLVPHRPAGPVPTVEEHADETAEAEAIARSGAGNDDARFVPALAGLGAPHRDACARGAPFSASRAARPAPI
jgi:glycerol kinase